jgi:small subunit ribosomal protein S6e
MVKHRKYISLVCPLSNFTSGLPSMKLNVAYPRNGTVKQFELNDDDLRKTNLFDYRLGNEVDGSLFGSQFKGYVFRLKGGSDKQGFPMVNGVMAASRVSLLIPRGAIGFNTFRGRSGERRRKALRGCICGPDLAVLNVVVQKIGESPIEGVTDVSVPRRLGPKRASKIRQLFNLSVDDDVKRFVVRRKVQKEGKKPRFKAPKVQRLITPLVKARRLTKLKSRQSAARKSQEERRDFLKGLARARMIHRQRKAAHDRLAQAARDKVAIGVMKKSGASKKK